MADSNPKIKIAIDLDDTIAQTSAAIVAWVKLNHPEDAHLFEHYLKRPEFKLKLSYNHELNGGLNEDSDRANKLILEALNSENFFLNLEPYPHAVENILSLSQKYTIYFCTSAGTYEYAASEKMAWIKKHFGPDWLSRTVITRAKDIVDVDILIDDRTDNAAHFLTRPKWTHILFDQSWNAKLNLPRINSWAEADDVITKFIQLKI